MEFKVYKDAKRFRRSVNDLLKKFPNSERYILHDQISRACLSIVLNIAEGSAKKSDKDFARFLGISIASINEVISALDVANDDNIISNNDLDKIKIEAEEIARQLGGFMKKLSNS